MAICVHSLFPSSALWAIEPELACSLFDRLASDPSKFGCADGVAVEHHELAIQLQCKPRAHLGW
jgi:hypothetical protein